MVLRALAALLRAGPVAIAQIGVTPKPKPGGAPGVTAVEAILVNLTDRQPGALHPSGDASARAGEPHEGRHRARRAR